MTNAPLRYYFESVESTQDIAREKARAGAPPGTAILADFQTAGRGRQGRTWFAPPGANVCMTVIGPPIALADAWQVALIAGIAAAEGIEEASLTTWPCLRFPNDLYLEGRKLGGILVETTPHPTPGFVTPLVGIGVNINVEESDFPAGLRDQATSLLRETGTRHEVRDVSEHILHCLTPLWQEPFDPVVLSLWQEWRDPDARRAFLLDGQLHSCRVLGLRGDGQVTLEDEKGTQHLLHAAQVILGDI